MAESKLSFLKADGIDNVIASAFELADPWKRGQIDRRMAEQAFAQLLMHSDLGLSFSAAASQAPKIDSATFSSMVYAALRGQQ